MTIPRTDAARLARRRREHERQVVIFGLLGVGLFAAMLYAVAVFTGAVAAGWDRPFSGAPEPVQAVAPPCLPSNPWEPYGTQPMPYNEVHLRILNASGLQGIAGAFSDVLGGRGFIVDSVGDHDSIVPENQLHFGREGLAAAYTIASQFERIVMVLDDRDGQLVDFLAGEGYLKPLPESEVQLAAGEGMHSLPGCVDLATITPIPAPTDLPEPEPVIDETPTDEDGEGGDTDE